MYMKNQFLNDLCELVGSLSTENFRLCLALMARCDDFNLLLVRLADFLTSLFVRLEMRALGMSKEAEGVLFLRCSPKFTLKSCCSNCAVETLTRLDYGYPAD